jgi:cyclic pyranopterin phosphate synthase
MTYLRATPASTVTDNFGRVLRYLRLSITDRCNMRCEYCSPNGACPTLTPEPLTWEDLRWIVQTATHRLGIEALRITGGEPTVRPGLVEWVQSLRGLGSLRDIALTSNGVRLSAMATPLSDAGVTRVNISLDSLQPDRFRTITRGGDVSRVLDGIAAAKEAFRQVKINTVALRNRNIDELAAFVAFSDREDLEVRFIEPMPLGDEKDYWREVFISATELRERLAGLGFLLEPTGERSGFGPSVTYRVAGTRARLGFISQMSCTKCATCNKLRLTSDGTLRPCLLSADEISLQPMVKARDEEGVVAALRGAFLARPAEYHLEEAVRQSLGRSMQCIGG